MAQKTLNPSEWFISLFFLALLFSIVVVSKVSSGKARNLLSNQTFFSEVQVDVQGEVLRPGLYEVLEGTSIEEVLKKAKPKRFADLSQIDLEAAAPKVLFIPALEKIRVLILGEGVKEPVELYVQPGTRIFQIKGQVPLLPNADLSIFQSRKMLKNGEEIRVGISK